VAIEQRSFGEPLGGSPNGRKLLYILHFAEQETRFDEIIKSNIALRRAGEGRWNKKTPYWKPGG
jgi:hypothetical protein